MKVPLRQLVQKNMGPCRFQVRIIAKTLDQNKVGLLTTAGKAIDSEKVGCLGLQLVCLVCAN